MPSLRALVAGALLFAALPTVARAATVALCEETGMDRATFIVPPYNKSILTAADDRVVIMYVDSFGEPVIGSSYLLMMVPDEVEPILDPVAGMTCLTIGGSEGSGFLALDFPALKMAKTDGKTVSFTVPVQEGSIKEDDGSVIGRPSTVAVTWTMATETLTVEQDGKKASYTLSDDGSLTQK